MSDHVRKQIRDALGLLLAGLPTTGARVFKSRSWPTKPADYPCLLIYARGGNSASDSEGEVTLREIERSERITIEGLVRATGEEPDDTLDRIALEVESKIATDEELGGLVDPMELLTTDLNAGLLGEARIGVLKLTFSAVCRTIASDPSNVVTNS